jgi:serine/threonine protein phosphatase PrpC
MADTNVSCPKCGEASPAGSHFCESCGSPLTANASPVANFTVFDLTRCKCGAAAESRDADGYCTVCGRKYEPPDPRDHIEEVLEDSLAAVTDKGKRHKRNEDDFAIGRNDKGVVLVVSDGVSSASNSNLASELASRAARDKLLNALTEPGPAKEAMQEAIMKAHEAASQVPMGEDGRPEPPGATIVAAVVKEGTVTVGWAGDSRAYWLGESRSIQLSKDHSWMEMAVDAGEVTPEEALKDPRAHAITQCIGPLNEGPPEASFVEFQITEPGHLMLCTDGLWGYAGAPDEIKSMLGDASPLEAARRFVHYAIEKGGIDNVTAVILQIGTL